MDVDPVLPPFAFNAKSYTLVLVDDNHTLSRALPRVPNNIYSSNIYIPDGATLTVQFALKPTQCSDASHVVRSIVRNAESAQVVVWDDVRETCRKVTDVKGARIVFDSDGTVWSLTSEMLLPHWIKFVRDYLYRLDSNGVVVNVRANRSNRRRGRVRHRDGVDDDDDDDDDVGESARKSFRATARATLSTSRVRTLGAHNTFVYF